MKTFMMAALGPGADEAKITEYCEGSVDHYNWLVDCGVPFKESFYGQPGWETPFDDGLMYSGGENSAPFNTIATPAPRGHIPQMADKKVGEKGGGYMLMKPLVETAEKLGVQAQYDMRVQTLVTDATGRVVGVQAKQYGKDVVVCAPARASCSPPVASLTTRTWSSEFAPRLIGRPGAAIEEHDGRSIRMAQALGADLAHMDATEVAFFGDPQMMVRGILVNGRGQRYVNEDTYPGRIGQLTLLQNDNQAYLIIDEDAYEEAKTTPSSTTFFRFQPKWGPRPSRNSRPRWGCRRDTAGDGRGLQQACRERAGSGAREEARVGQADRLADRSTGPAQLHRRIHAGWSAHQHCLRGAARVGRSDSRPLRGRSLHRRRLRMGLRVGHSLGDGSFFGRRAGISAAKG